MAQRRKTKRWQDKIGHGPQAQVTPQGRAPDRYVAAAICCGILLAVAIVFGQTVSHEFVNFDDGDYVYENTRVQAGLTGDGIVWAFTKENRTANWIPLTWLSLMLDSQLYGPKASGGYHLTNVLLHAANAVLLLLALRQMTGDLWRSAVVATLFAVHPLHVESVAWVTERKDVLSGLFGMLALWSYSWYAQGPCVPRYLLVAVALALGLMAKAVLITWPFLFLLLDYWPLRRRLGIGLILEKLPLAALAGGSATVTYMLQQRAGTLVSLGSVSLSERLCRATVLYTTYLARTFLPANLAAQYPNVSIVSHWPTVGAGLLLLLLTAGALWGAWHGRPWLATGWFWYLGTLAPNIGVVQLGLQVRADRFMYLPQIGLCVALVWGVAASACQQWRHRAVCGLAACSALVWLAVLAWRQTATWHDGMSLWTHALAMGYDTATAHHNIACRLEEAGNFDAALGHYQEAIRLSPEMAEPRIGYGRWLVGRGRIDEGIEQYRLALQISSKDTSAETGLGLALAARGDLDGAVAHFQRAIEFGPENASACYNLGKAYVSQGRIEKAAAAFEQTLKICPTNAEAAMNLANIRRNERRSDEALQLYRRAIELRPNYAEARYNLGLLLDDLGRSAEAVEQFRKALEMNPRNAHVHNAFGSVLLGQGLTADAIEHFRTALAIDPKLDLPHANLARALSQQGKNAAAIAEYRIFLRSQPDHAYVLRCLASILATAGEDSLRNGKEAVAFAEKAAALQPNDAQTLDTLAAAYAEAGRFKEAVAMARKATLAAQKTKSQPLIDGIAARLRLYEAGKPYRDAGMAK